LALLTRPAIVTGATQLQYFLFEKHCIFISSLQVPSLGLWQFRQLRICVISCFNDLIISAALSRRLFQSANDSAMAPQSLHVTRLALVNISALPQNGQCLTNFFGIFAI
jgi:hypothetical protein